MIHLFSFVPKDKPAYQGDWVKPLEAFADDKRGIQKEWGGFFAYFAPGESPAPIQVGYAYHSAWWFASDKGKLIKKAKLVVPNK